MDEKKLAYDMNVESLTACYERMLTIVGEEILREGLLKTPKRAAKALLDLTSGYNVDMKHLINDALFSSNNSEMVVVKDIPFYSLCEHHLLPFFGKAYVAYIPSGKVIGLSKIPRIVNAFARRLQIQENMTQQIAQTLKEHLNPLGVGVVLQAQHMCMEMRGVEKIGSSTTTSEMLDVFRDDPKVRSEFLSLIQP
jgi:GTP cyclohydrolase I